MTSMNRIKRRDDEDDDNDDDDYQSLMQTDDATPSLPRRTQFPHARVFSYLCICHLVTSLFSLTMKRANILLKWSLSYICGVTAIQTRYGVRSLGLPLSFLFSGSMIMNAIRHPGRKEPLPPSLLPSLPFSMPPMRDVHIHAMPLALLLLTSLSATWSNMTPRCYVVVGDGFTGGYQVGRIGPQCYNYIM